MSRADINISGASGGGSSVQIYETPEYNHRWNGACIMHGSFTTGPTSPDSQRIEVVELCLPGLDIRVCADSVRTELRALLAANKAWEEGAGCPTEHQPARHKAFVKLQAAVFGVAASGITVAHIERIAHEAYADGLRDGKEALREQFRQLLDL
jgi:hypothetical protein